MSINEAVRHLTAAAASIGIRISPTYDGDTGLVTVPETDAAALARGSRTSRASAGDARSLQALLMARRGPVDLSAVDALRVARALDDLKRASDRAARVNAGTFTGPMSGSEALRFSRARMRRGH